MVALWQKLEYYLEQKWFIYLLLLINIAGSIYGFYWYKNQLAETPIQWLIFTPDSPLASTYFSIFLILYLFKKKSRFIEALASVTLFKYGLWATIIIIWGSWLSEPSFSTLSWIDIMLMTSHLGMAFQALLFNKKYNYGFISLLIAGIWILTNDFLDYTQNIYPWLPSTLGNSEHMVYTVGEFTLYLSGFTLLIFYILSIFRRKNE